MLFAVERAFFEVVNKIQIFLDRHFEIERRGFGKKTDLFLHGERMLENIQPVHHSTSRRGGEISREDIHRCGFSRAVRTEKANDFAFFDFKADVVYGIAFAVLFCQMFHFYHNSMTIPFRRTYS